MTPSTSTGWLLSVSPVISSWGSTSRRTCPGLPTPSAWFFLTTLKKNRLSSDILVNFYRCALESILTNCVTVWCGSCSVAERKALQRVVKTAQRIIGTPLPATEDIQRKRCLRRARNILKDSSHPALFSPLSSGRCFRCLRTRTSRLKNSYFHNCLFIELCTSLIPQPLIAAPTLFSPPSLHTCLHCVICTTGLSIHKLYIYLHYQIVTLPNCSFALGTVYLQNQLFTYASSTTVL